MRVHRVAGAAGADVLRGYGRARREYLFEIKTAQHRRGNIYMERDNTFYFPSFEMTQTTWTI